MKQVLLFTFLLLFGGYAFGQTTIAIQDFEDTPATPTWNYSGTASITATASKFNGAKSLRLSGSNTVTFDNISLSGYTSVTLSVAFASVGADSDEDLFMDISYNNGSTWAGAGSIKLVDGFSNANININTTNASNPTTVGSNSYPTSISSSETQIMVRFRPVGLDANEYYFIDDVKLTGTLASGCTAPTDQASAITFPSVMSPSLSLNWTNGNGAGRVIIMNTTNTFTDPSNGANPTPNLTYGGSGQQVVFNGTGSGPITINGLTAGNTYHFRVYEYCSTDRNYQTATATNNPNSVFVPKPEPTNYPSGFACGTTTSGSIPLNWTDASSGTIPDGYLIKWSSTSYAAIATPADGTAEANGATTQNVAQGVQTYTASGLSASTTYFFKIWSYTNSGININYKLVSEPQTICATIAGPCFSSNGPSFTTSGFTIGGDTDAGGSPTTTIRLASTGSGGSISTTATGVTAGNVTLTFRAKGWSSTETSVTVTLDGNVQNVTNLPTAFGEVTLNFTSISANPTLTFSTVANKRVHIGNVKIFCTPACTAPSQASAVTTNTPNTDGFSMGWTAGSGIDGTMLVIRPTAQTNAAPVSGTIYTPNLAWISAAHINTNNRVVHRGTGTTAGPVSGLNAETQYTITAYAYNNTGDCYNLTSPPSATRWTLSTEPTAHATTFTSVAAAYDQVNLTYTTPGSGADGYVILRRADGVAPTTSGIVDAVAPASWSLPSGTVIANANATGSGWNNTGLTGSTNYCYLLIPFNWNGSNAETYNYRTASTMPTTCSTTPATPSNESNVVDNTNYATGTPEFNSNINYINFIDGTSTTTGKMIPMKLKIQDGGNDLIDADNFNTILTGIKLTVRDHLAANQLSQIKTAILTTTTGTVIATATKVGTELVFSGMSGTNVTAFDQDNAGAGEKIIHLRVSFDETQVIDNTKLIFAVSDVTAGASSSIFAAANGGGATTDGNNANDRNRIEVNADRLAFVQQPSTTTVSTNMNPSVSVSANDLYNRRDLDFTSSISITSTGTLSSSPQTATAASGLATFSAINHTVAATGRTLTAERNGSGDWDVPSNTFAIINCTPPIWEENFDYGCVDNDDILSIPEASANWTIRTVSPNGNFNYDEGGNLSYSGYTPTGGGAGRFVRGANRDNIKRLINPNGSTVTSGTVYTSFLVNFNNNSGNGDDYFFSFRDQNDNLRGRIHVDNSSSSGTGTKFRFGVSKFGTSTSAFQTGEYDFGTTYLCVVKYEIISGSDNDRISLWVLSSGMPVSETAAGSATIASTSGADWGTGNNEMKYILLRQTSAGADGFIDGLRVGTSWEDLACSTTPAANSYTWTGNSSGVWANPNNWSPNTGYPTAIDNVTISTSTPNKLNITDCRTVKNFTLNGTGNFDMSVDGSLTITGTTAYDGTDGAGTSSNLACATQVQEDAGIEGSHVYITSSDPQIVPPLNYANLDVQGGDRTFLSGKTIGICARFIVNPTLYNYTVAGSTVDYNSALSGWILTPFTYHNLKFSGSGDFSVGFSTTNANKTIHVLNDFTQTAGTVFLGENSTATATLNIDGNMTLTGGLFDMNSINGGKGTLNLKGDLSIAAAATINATSTTVANTNFNFTGTYNPTDLSTIQTFGIASTAAARNQNITFTTKTGAYSQLSGSNLELGSRSLFSVEAAATLDFGFNGTTALILTQVTAASPAPTFAMTGNSTIVITHPNGIDRWILATDRAIDGNVQVSGTRSFSSTGIYHYKGKGFQQRLGDGILSGGISGKHVIVELENLTTQLLFEGNAGTSTTTFSELADVGLSNIGNGLKIIEGTVVGTTTSDFMSTGNIEMTGGLYKIAYPYGTSNVVPRLSGTYTLTGGTIELTGSSDQVLRGGNSPNTPNYYNLKMSGANTVNINNTPIVVTRNLEISNASTTFDVENNSMTGNAGVTMSAGLLRLSAKGVTLPQLDGVATPYSLTGGTVELYGTSSSQTHSIRGTYNGTPGTNINYYNIELNSIDANVGASGANIVAQTGFGVAGTMNVNSPTCFQLGSGFTITDAGNSTFDLKAGATLKYGGSIVASGASGNIRTDNRTFPTTASYGFVGSITPQDPGAGLPSSMVNMYLDKTNAGDLVTITQDEEMTNSLAFYKGIVKTDANTMYVSNAATSAITGANTAGNDKYVQGRLQRKVNSGSTYSFPIGHSLQNAQGFSITPTTGTNGSNILGFLEANATSLLQPIAYCDLEIKTAPGQQIGQGTAGLDGALDQITFNLASPLQWDVTNPGGGITAYNITVNANGGQDISPVTSAGGTPIRYLMKNGEPGNTGVTTGTGGTSFPQIGFLTCPNGYALSGMTSFSDFTVNGASGSNTALPVKWLYFTAKYVDQHVQLDWATALEINNDGFELQRSTDAQNWTNIAWINGNDNSTITQFYVHNDMQVVQNITYYYRLKQIDNDGQFVFSNIVSASLNGNNASFDVLDFIPNPTVDQTTLLISSGAAQTIAVSFYNTIGQVVQTNTHELSEGMNQITFDVNTLAVGTYMATVTSGNEVRTKRLVITR